MKYYSSALWTTRHLLLPLYISLFIFMGCFIPMWAPSQGFITLVFLVSQGSFAVLWVGLLFALNPLKVDTRTGLLHIHNRTFSWQDVAQLNVSYFRDPKVLRGDCILTFQLKDGSQLECSCDLDFLKTVSKQIPVRYEPNCFKGNTAARIICYVVCAVLLLAALATFIWPQMRWHP